MCRYKPSPSLRPSTALDHTRQSSSAGIAGGIDLALSIYLKTVRLVLISLIQIAFRHPVNPNSTSRFLIRLTTIRFLLPSQNDPNNIPSRRKCRLVVAISPTSQAFQQLLLP